MNRVHKAPTPKPVVQTTPAASTSTTTDPAAAPTANVVNAHRNPTLTDGFKGVVSDVASTIAKGGPGPYELTPGRYPDAIGLPQFLAKLGSTPEGQQAVKGLLETLKGKTGIVLPPEVQAALLSNPSAATTALELTPKQVSSGILALNAAYQAGKVKPVVPDPNLLPQSFDLKGIDTLDAPRPQPEMKELAPGLFTGDLPTDLPDAQVKTNRVMAEVFTRLSTDLTEPTATKFSVDYNGQSYSRLDDFLGALRSDGYDVNITFMARTANFADLKTKVPGSDPVQWLDVPAPLMVKTGIKGASGKEAVVSASHSQMVIDVKSGPNTKGPKLDSQVRFFQGVDGTGFFPGGVVKDPNWLGSVTHTVISGDQAVKALGLAGALSDVIDDAAKALNLYADGYGVTGVCNDSVAVIQQAMTGSAPQYPLFMRDDLLFGELKKRLDVPADRDTATYQALRDAIAKVPSDMEMTSTTRARALASIPWVEGKEPFDSTAEARKILQNAVDVPAKPTSKPVFDTN